MTVYNTYKYLGPNRPNAVAPLRSARRHNGGCCGALTWPWRTSQAVPASRPLINPRTPNPPPVGRECARTWGWHAARFPPPWRARHYGFAELLLAQEAG